MHRTEGKEYFLLRENLLDDNLSFHLFFVILQVELKNVLTPLNLYEEH